MEDRNQNKVRMVEQGQRRRTVNWLLWLLLLLVAIVILAGLAVAYMGRNKATNNPATSNPQQGNTTGTNTNTQNRLYVVSNPSGIEKDNVLAVPADLASISKTLGDAQGVSSLEHIAIANNGDAYITADVGAATRPSGAILVVTRIQNANNIGAATRRIEGANTGLLSPKGIEISENPAMIFVADSGAKNIKVYRLDASGDQSPTNTVTNLGASAGVDRTVWDLAYVGGTLYATTTDGAILAYDNFTRDFGTTGPSRTIIPIDAQGSKAASTLRGIDVVPANGNATIIVSDLGQPSATADGAIYALGNATGAKGNTPVLVQIKGDKTTMGDPTSVRVNQQNGDVYVADKVNNRVLGFANILQARGVQNATPKSTLQVASPESISFGPSQ